ncbi:MAG TPA: hypothetical protein VGV89_09220 [Thermoplasmata archaeon]|nr:hypothetical protein [Thermoplasmata archaeon]
MASAITAPVEPLVPELTLVPPAVPVPAEPTVLPPRLAPRIVLRPRSRSAASRPLLPTEGTLFPWLERRFAPGEATLWMGPSSAVDRILGLLYAGSAAAGGRISLLEGANRFDPYRIAEGGRAVGVDPGVVLERIRLARAFTAYQLVALVDGWAKELRRHRPTLLVAHELPLLFESEEVPVEERAPLLTHVAGQLRRVAEATRRPMLITLAGGPARFPGLAERGPRMNDVVRFQPGEGRLRLNAYKEAAECLLLPRPPGQHGLEEFAPITDAEVMAWDAPPRRTGRRSRSG